MFTVDAIKTIRMMPHIKVNPLSYMLGIILALGAALFWALEPSIYVLGMKDTSPLLANAIRTLAAGGFSLLMAIIWDNFFGQPFDWIQVVFLIAVTSLGMGFGDWLFFTCIKNAGVTFVAGFSSTYPLVVALLAIIFGTEQLNPLTLLASIIIVTGVIIVSKTKPNVTEISRTDSIHPELTIKQYGTTAALALLAAATWGVTIFGLGLSMKHFTPLSANAIRITAVGSFLMLTHVIPSSNRNVTTPSIRSFILLCVGGILGLGIGSSMMLAALNMIGTTRSSALFSVSPFFAALLAILILKEKTTMRRLSGIIFVSTGILLISIS